MAQNTGCHQETPPGPPPTIAWLHSLAAISGTATAASNDSSDIAMATQKKQNLRMSLSSMSWFFSANDWRCSIDQGHFESMTEDTGSCKMMRLRQRAWHNINSNSERYWLVKRDFHSGWWESAWCQAVQSHIAISPQGRIGYCSSDFWEYCALVKADWKLWAEQLCHH